MKSTVDMTEFKTGFHKALCLIEDSHGNWGDEKNKSSWGMSLWYIIQLQVAISENLYLASATNEFSKVGVKMKFKTNYEFETKKDAQGVDSDCGVEIIQIVCAYKNYQNLK